MGCNNPVAKRSSNDTISFSLSGYAPTGNKVFAESTDSKGYIHVKESGCKTTYYGRFIKRHGSISFVPDSQLSFYLAKKYSEDSIINSLYLHGRSKDLPAFELELDGKIYRINTLPRNLKTERKKGDIEVVFSYKSKFSIIRDTLSVDAGTSAIHINGTIDCDSIQILDSKKNIRLTFFDDEQRRILIFKN